MRHNPLSLHPLSSAPSRAHASAPGWHAQRLFFPSTHQPRLTAFGHDHESARRRNRWPFEHDTHDQPFGRLGDDDAPEDALGVMRRDERSRPGHRLFVALPSLLPPVAALDVVPPEAPDKSDHASSSTARSAMILSCTCRGMAS